MQRRFSRVLRLLTYGLLAGLVYVFSYAPFLWVVTMTSYCGPHYRSPIVYRAVDWCVVNTPARSVLLNWAACFGVEVEGTTEMQAWYFAQGVSDTSGFHINIIQP